MSTIHPMRFHQPVYQMYAGPHFLVALKSGATIPVGADTAERSVIGSNYVRLFYRTDGKERTMVAEFLESEIAGVVWPEKRVGIDHSEFIKRMAETCDQPIVADRSRSQ